MSAVLVNLVVSLLVGLAATAIGKFAARLKVLVALTAGAILFAVAILVTFVSNPPKPIVAVPDVGSFPEAQATAVLTNAGFQTARVYQNSDDVPQYKVCRQDPAPGMQCSKGEKVTIWVSQGRASSVSAGAQWNAHDEVGVDQATSQASTVTITEPASGVDVGFRNLVRGRLASVPENLDLWIVVYPRAFPRYHPQTEPARRSNDGTWSATAYIGVSPNSDIGGEFDLHAVLTDHAASKEFLEYLQNAAKAADWPGLLELPTGAHIVYTVTVTRRAG